MSFISMIATDQFASVVADGLMTSSSGYVDENYKKFRTYGREMVVAFGGSYSNFEGLFDQVMDAYRSAGSLSDYFSRVDSLISRISYSSSTALLLCLTVAFKNGEGAYLTTSNNGELRSQKQLSSDFEYAFLSPDGVSRSSINSQLEMLFTSRLIQSVDEIVGVQHQLNDFVADRDISVNHNINYAVITK